MAKKREISPAQRNRADAIRKQAVEDRKRDIARRNGTQVESEEKSPRGGKVHNVRIGDVAKPKEKLG